MCRKTIFLHMKIDFMRASNYSQLKVRPCKLLVVAPLKMLKWPPYFTKSAFSKISESFLFLIVMGRNKERYG
ncbi:hypothetical protein IAD21_00440 [Abditibacteriota bacterium]|nr:hypothetical protein IAD21_00440 [Abditibacteriota bacterium]